MSTETTTQALRARYASAPIALSVRLTGTCPHGKPSNKCCGYAEWLQVIHAVNADFRARHGGFEDVSYIGAPLDSYAWWAGGYAEEYTEWRVLLRDDGTTNLQAKTATAAEYLHRAVLEVCGFDVDDNGMRR